MQSATSCQWNTSTLHMCKQSPVWWLIHADMAPAQKYLDLQHCRVPRLGLNDLATVWVSKCLAVCLVDCQPALRPPPAPAGHQIYFVGASHLQVPPCMCMSQHPRLAFKVGQVPAPTSHYFAQRMSHLFQTLTSRCLKPLVLILSSPSCSASFAEDS